MLDGIPLEDPLFPFFSLRMYHLYSAAVVLEVLDLCARWKAERLGKSAFCGVFETLSGVASLVEAHLPEHP